VYRLAWAGQDIIFLARHGVEHCLPPHRINYRANIWALHTLGVREVVATQAVGSMHPDIEPGHVAILGQFIDWTRCRPATFFDGDSGVIHVDVSQPYCPRLSARLHRAGQFLGERLHSDVVYACTEGPRFETAAEITALRRLGADVVGMTNVPEVVLAREAGLCYAAVSIVSNWGAGISDQPLTQDEVLTVIAEQTTSLRYLLNTYLSTRDDDACCCQQSGYGHHLPHLLPS